MVIVILLETKQLYKISLYDATYHVDSTSNANVSTKRKYNDNETSSKLWHCRLGHISRGRIERLIKDNILHPLDFSDANVEHCIDCIKGKYAKKNQERCKLKHGSFGNNPHRYLWSL